MRLSVVFAAAFLSVPSFAAEEQTAVIAFESEDWTITNGRIVDHLGRKALAGSAFLKDVDFTDGIIEVDIAMDGRRCFPGIIFRAESEADTEIFYVRPHRPKNYSHALQYTPRFKGLTGWQLYSGPGFTAGGDIPLDRWVHVKLEVQGSRARIYFDDMEEPALVVSDLRRGTTGGFIGVSSPPDGRVHFSDFRFSSDEALDFGPLPIRAVSRAGLTDWELSQPIAPLKINRDLSPNAQDIGEIEWQKMTADRSGLVDVARFLEHQPQLPQCVLARTAITVEQPERRKLLFGYSDEISVFLNGELLFRGDSAFKVRDSEFMGIVGLNDAVVLDLNQGINELLFVITESFGGWGFMARTENLRTDPVLLADGVAKLWELADGLVMPESAAWDPKRDQFYVSNINPAGAADFGEQGFISRIDAEGQVLDIGWVTGLRGPTGVAVLDDRLYVVERTGVAVIDLEKGEIVDRRLIESEGGFLNDLAVDSNGTLFVSDSSLGAIYRVKSGETELWLRNGAIAGANGLVVQGDRLIATTMGSESLVSINLETAKIESIVDLRPFGGDGITADGTDAFLVSDFNGLLLRVTPTGDRDVLIDTRDVGISLTDFAFAPEHALVVVPTLRGNSVMAFKLN
jgi:sugar lactone lactonase YvrE